MKILVAGGNGFIGSNLCKLLLKQGNEVISLDDNSTGSLENVSDLINNPLFTNITHNIINPITYEFYNLDQIYNLACPASPKDYQSEPIKTIKVNTLGVLNLLELSIKYKSKYLFASTSEIYGDPLVSPQSENYRGNVNTTGIRSCYDEGKRIGETIVFEYSNKYNIDTKIARIFNTYGPKMKYNDGRVISNFIWYALNDKPLTIYGDGTQTRSFCYVDDTINGLIKLMDSKIKGPVNIGNPNEMTILEVGTKILNLLNKENNFEYMELPMDDPHIRNPDISKAKNELGWLPSIHLDDGLIKTIDYYKKKL